jgi:hypothetical protein
MRYVRRRRGRSWAKWLYAALFAAVAVGCGDDDPEREVSSSGIVRTRGGPIRPMAPLSGSVSGSRQPVFSFNEGRSGRVEICYDRACDQVIESMVSNYGRAQPETPLPAGTLFWRVVSHHGPSAVWQLVIPSRDSGLTTAFGVVPDYTGDGLADIAIGVPASPNGTVQVSFGRPFPVPAFNVTLEGGDQFGRGIAAVGDLNGDGFVDLAVASGVDPGVVTIYNGGPLGPSMGLTLSAGPLVSVGFGMTMASAGDVDCDGYGDIVVGGLEIAQVFLGSASGVVAKAAFTLAGATGGNALTVQGPGDVNGDGNPDVLVGGVIYLGNGKTFTAQTPFTPGLGAAFVGDDDGDGLTDVAAGGGILPGSPAGVDPGRSSFFQLNETVFAAAGDVDGDGHADVVSRLKAGSGFAERERVYFGAPTGCATAGCREFSRLFITGHDNAGGDLRAIIAAAGDIDGDGGDDLVVATPDNRRVHIYLAGGARGVPLQILEPQRFTFTSDTSGFGSSLAGLFGTAPASP